jgi:hypothetical protein
MVKRVFEKEPMTTAKRMKLISLVFLNGTQGPAPVVKEMSDYGLTRDEIGQMRK